MASTMSENQTFFWIGTDRSGARIKGQTDGPNEAMVKVALRKQGINPIMARHRRFTQGLTGAASIGGFRHSVVLRGMGENVFNLHQLRSAPGWLR